MIDRGRCGPPFQSEGPPSRRIESTGGYRVGYRDECSPRPDPFDRRLYR